MALTVSPACPQMAAQISPACSFPKILLSLFFFHWVMKRGSSLGDRDRHGQHPCFRGFLSIQKLLGSFLLTHHSFPGYTSRETKEGSCEVSSQDLFFSRENFFSNNYRIIINTQERHDVKMKLLKTFLD